VVTRTLQMRAYLPDSKGKNDAPAPVVSPSFRPRRFAPVVSPPVVLSPRAFCRPGTGRSGRFQGPLGCVVSCLCSSLQVDDDRR
jgi:hypothetical protein